MSTYPGRLISTNGFGRKGQCSNALLFFAFPTLTLFSRCCFNFVVQFRDSLINRQAETFCHNYQGCQYAHVSIINRRSGNPYRKKVMYGAEIIVPIQRDVLCREMKENVGDDIHEGAVAYFNEAIKSVHYSTKATTPA